MHYKHTQIGYFIIAVTFIVGAFFLWMYISALQEAPSYDSGPNFAITSLMAVIIGILASFTSLQVRIDDSHLRIKFGYGIYRTSFALDDIVAVRSVRNHRYYGRGIRVRLRPKMWIYNVSGLDAVEIQLQNGSIYRIGTDEPATLEQALRDCIS